MLYICYLMTVLKVLVEVTDSGTLKEVIDMYAAQYGFINGRFSKDYLCW